MYHVMLLCFELGVEIGSTTKDEISWLHLLLLELNRKRIELVCLIPPIKMEPKVISKIKHDLPHESTAVEVQRCVVVLLSLFPVSASVWDTEVFLGGLNELLSEALLELWVLSVREILLCDVVAVLYIILFGFSESLKLLLESCWIGFFGSTEKVWLLFHFLWLLDQRL